MKLSLLDSFFLNRVLVEWRGRPDFQGNCAHVDGIVQKS